MLSAVGELSPASETTGNTICCAAPLLLIFPTNQLIRVSNFVPGTVAARPAAVRSVDTSGELFQIVVSTAMAVLSWQ